jgi:hypothetical protein
MKQIKFKAIFQTPDDVVSEIVEVTAKDINSGVRKALPIALKGRPKNHEFHRIEFWEASR